MLARSEIFRKQQNYVIPIRTNFPSKTNHRSENIKILWRCTLSFTSSVLSHQIPCSADWTTLLLRNFVVKTWTSAQKPPHDFRGRAFFFCYFFPHFRHFICPFMASYPFHTRSGRHLSLHAVEVCQWHHRPLGQLPGGRLANFYRSTPGSLSNPELFLLPLILQELF